MVTFRVIGNKVRPFGKDGVSSSIGAPTRTTERGATPQTFGGVTTSSGGIFSARHAVNRLLNKANEANLQARASVKEAGAARKQQDDEIVREETEALRKIRSDQQKQNIKSLQERIKEIGTGKSKEEKKRKDEQKKLVEETLEKEKDLNWKTENFNIGGETINALKFQSALKGDKEAQEILNAIAKRDWKKANKLAENRQNKLNEAFAERSRIESEKTQELLGKAGYVPNTQGQFIATDRTPEIASEEFDIPITKEENEILKQNPIQPPPKITATEVAILANTRGGKERLREWGYAV